MKTIAAGKFKAECLAIMDEVQAKREPVLVTKNGRPVAKLVPATDKDELDSIFGFYKGKIELKGDVMAPVYTDQEYEEFFEKSAAQLK